MRKLYYLLSLTSMLMVFVFHGYSQKGYSSNQPYASYWLIDELLDWNPVTDPDADFNKSNVKIMGERFEIPALKANPHARNFEAKINNLSIFAATSGNPSQGDLKANYYAYTYWEYCDLLVLWGGSAGEGIILAPNPTIIDASHRNGVKVLGTIFLPPNLYGGKLTWVEDLVQKVDGKFPVADKLIEAAEFYGFDGWFVNQETSGGDAQLALDMQEFMKYFQANSDLELEWYDSMVKSGSVSWQDQLNAQNEMFFQDADTLVSEHMFLNFWWYNSSKLANSRTYAQSLGRSEFDLYAGIDVQAKGFNTSADWNTIFPEGKSHVTSLGFYCPSWTKENATDYKDFFTKENRFWVGKNGDPSITNGADAWPGLAHYVASKSNITELPFVTNFCTGNGVGFYINGKNLFTPAITSGWNNLSTQDIQTTWKWLMESEAEKRIADLCFDDAYYGGNCIEISGNSSADNLLKLFATKLQVSPTTVFELTYKTGKIGGTAMQVGLSYSNDPTNFEFTDVENTTSVEWNTFKINLGSHNADTIAAISLKYLAGTGEGYSMKIGRVAVYNGDVDIPEPISNLSLINKNEIGNTEASIRLKWDHSTSDIYYYNVYRKFSDDSLIHLGATPNNAYFVPKIFKEEAGKPIEIVVQTVSKEFGHSTLSEPLVIDWLQGPEKSYGPIPEDGEVEVQTDLLYITWKTGSGSDSFDVYFGKTNPPKFIGNQTGKFYLMPNSLDTSTTYFWRVDGVNELGATQGDQWSFTTNSITTSSIEFNQQMFNLNHFPNPFNESINISYNLIQDTKVTINIYSLSGKLIKNLVKRKQASGSYSVMWNGADANGSTVNQGTYIYQFITNNAVIVKKIIKL